MAPNIGQIVSERKAALKALYQTSKNLDTELESVQRGLKRLLARKRSLPDSSDLPRYIETVRTMSSMMDQWAIQWADTSSLFNAY